jgi:hypothetical protein
MAALSIAFCLLALQANNCHAREPAWFLVQKQKGLGEERIYVAKSGRRGEEVQFGSVVVTRSQDPNYYFFNPSKRIYYVGDKSKNVSNENVRIAILMGLTSHSSQNMNWSLMAFHKDGNSSILKIPVSKFVGIDAHKKTWEIWTSNALGITEDQCARMCEFRGLPIVGGLPLRIISSSKTGGKEIILDTTDAHKTTVTAEDFKCPKDYKRVSNLYEVMCAQSTFLNDALETLDTRK